MQLQGVLDIIVLIVACEATVEAIFRAGPLQGLRNWIIEKTPWASTVEQGHLLECKYCTSFWVGAILALAYMTVWSFAPIRWFCLVLAIHRLSNFTHLPFSYLRDLQLDIRINRRRQG